MKHHIHLHPKLHNSIKAVNTRDPDDLAPDMNSQRRDGRPGGMLAIRDPAGLEFPAPLDRSNNSVVLARRVGGRVRWGCCLCPVLVPTVCHGGGGERG